MKTAILALVLLTWTGVSQAQTIKPGLWESKVVKMVMDGNDMTAMMANMSKQMGNMPPDARAKSSGVVLGPNGGIRMCISPDMAAKYMVGGDPQGRCPPTSASVSGNKFSFAINCTSQGHTITGTGQSVMNGDSISSHVDMKMADARGAHTMVADSQMTFIGSDCQGITPLDRKQAEK